MVWLSFSVGRSVGRRLIQKLVLEQEHYFDDYSFVVIRYYQLYIISLPSRLNG